MAPSVVNTWQTSTASSYTYGTVQLGIANTNGNWLFAIAQWEQTEDTTVVFCTDNAHNFYQPVVISAPNQASRTAILAVQNAAAAASVSFSTTGFVRNAIYTVIEVAGMPGGYVIDASAINAVNGTSVTVSTTATQADFVLTSMVQDATGSTITAPTGYTTVMGSATANTTLKGWAAWENVSAGAVTATWASTVSGPFEAVIVCVASSAVPPVNANPNWPVISVQAAFGFQPGDTTSYPTWTDISARFLGLKGDRGRQYELDQLEAADVTITLDNADGALSPFNSSSPYAPNVLLLTPIRLLATWQGRIYQVFSGHIEYIPQTYDFQRGVVQAQCADSFAKLPQVLLQSAMQQEILYDNPYLYYPCNDAPGSPFASNRAGRGRRTFDVTNRFGGLTNAFGITQSQLGGDQGTVWGVQGGNVATIAVSSLRYHDEASTLPSISNGITIECWCKLPSGTGALTMGSPQIIMALEGNSPTTLGQIISVNSFGVTISVSVLQLTYYDSSGTVHNITLANQDMWDGSYHHYLLILTGATYKFYLDGTLVSNAGLSLIRNDPRIFEVAALTNKFATAAGYASIPETGTSNLTWAHVAYYDKVLDPERITTHFQSGSTGFAKETSGPRIMRLLNYAKWGKPQGIDNGQSQQQALSYLGSSGYASLGLRATQGLFGSYGTASNSGSQVDLAVADVAAGENGLLFIDRNGSFIFRGRNSIYDPNLAAAFGDSFLPLNQNPYFQSTLSPWTAGNNGTLASGKAVYTYSGVGSMMLHGDGVTATPFVISETTIPIVANQSYTINCWLYTPQGISGSNSVLLGINWYNSVGAFISASNGTGFNLNPQTPTQGTWTATAPGTAFFAAAVVKINGTPPSSTQLVIDRITLSGTGFQTAYEGDIQIDYDVTYLYNDIQITRNADQVSFRITDTASQKQYFPRVYTRTIYTYPDNPPDEMTGCADWLLQAYKQPSPRISHMVIDAASNPDAWTTALSVDVGDTVTVTRDPIGAPAILEQYFVVGVSPEIGPSVATFTYNLAPTLLPVLTLDSPVFGILDNNSLGW